MKLENVAKVEKGFIEKTISIQELQNIEIGGKGDSYRQKRKTRKSGWSSRKKRLSGTDRVLDDIRRNEVAE